MAKKHFSLVVPARFIFFQYRDVPGEFHAVCLETSSFGVGSTQYEALESLSLSLNAQIANDVLTTGFTPSVDPEWEKAWTEGKHPVHEEMVLGLKGVGQILVNIEKRSASAELRDEIRIDNAAQRNLELV